MKNLHLDLLTMGTKRERRMATRTGKLLFLSNRIKTIQVASQDFFIRFWGWNKRISDQELKT